MPNGFTGNFHFDAEAQAAQSSTDKKQPVTININGHTVVINVETGTTPVGPGVSSLRPVDVSKLYINKGGYFGKDGKINWGIDGTTPAPISSDVTITDTPSGNIKAPIDPNSWTIRVTAANGLSQFFTLQQAKDELRAKVTFDQKGGFTAVFPADVLQNTKWHIQYQAVPEKTPTNGDTFDNHAQIKYDQIVKDTDKTVQYKQNMGGEIVGFDSGNLTLQKQDGDTKVLLSGAQFTLYKDGTVVDTKTTGKDGKVVFNNLTDGNYTLKETKAPAGYQVSNKEYHFTISKGQLTNSDLPKNFILPNYKMASSSSAVKSSSKASSKKSSAVKSSSKASSKKSSSAKSSSVESSSKKSSAVKSSSKASSAKSSSVESSSSKKASSESSVSVVVSNSSSIKKGSEHHRTDHSRSMNTKSSLVSSSSKKNTEKSSSVESSSKKNTEKSSSVESSSKKNTEKSSSVESSSKKNTEESSVMSSSTNGSAKESSANDHKQGSSESDGKEAQSSNGHKAGVVVTNNNNGNGNNTGHGQGNGRGNGNGNGSSYGSGLPQTGETQLTISLIAGVAILAGVAGATVLNKKKK
ncbi:SpaA isopeptide-forming pilin-related protein [Ligilactobacillus aviarius]|uniref:SpaA isopeptide-forming pilin-related protein n=1 Tax=Ligilactobacillus aviarius TaxID=1606 RepID=UPI00195D95D9|nr:SpaA isopeptide-forming pilin-related protein [Ligilactobacillus aviarius]MBM6863289.1 LPXTG cell wall anchor domain-containing protein [Ligilactobacillus aviarius]